MLRDLDWLEDLQAALAAGELDSSPRTRLVVADLLASGRTHSPRGDHTTHMTQPRRPRPGGAVMDSR
jgi:hypothetical protein